MAGFAVSACTPRAGTHGDPLVRDRVSSIVPGVHSRDDVAAILGSPSTNSPFDGEKWYYISSRTETFAFFPREEFDLDQILDDPAGVGVRSDDHDHPLKSPLTPRRSRHVR